MTGEPQPEQVERDARKTSENFEDCAELYAELRADTAARLGIDEDVDHWTAVRQRLQGSEHDG